MDRNDRIEFDSMFKIEMCILDHSVDWQRLNEDYQVNGLDCTRSSCNILICGTVMSEWK